MKNGQNFTNDVHKKRWRSYGEKRHYERHQYAKTSHLKCVMYNIYIIIIFNNVNNLLRVVSNSLFKHFYDVQLVDYMKKKGVNVIERQ